MSEVDATRAERFLEALKRGDLERRRALIADLRGRRTAEAVSLLLDVLLEDSWYLRELAVDALADAGADAAPGLLALLESGLWYTRAAAARALGKLGEVPSIPRLVGLLTDPNHTVRGACLASLAEFVEHGHAGEVAGALAQTGARRAEELKRLFLAMHPTAGETLTVLLENPGDRGPP